METLSIKSKEEVLGYIWPICERLERIIDVDYLDDEPNNNQMQFLMLRALENCFISQPYVKDDRVAFKEAADACSDEYDIFDDLFYDMYDNSEQNQKVCWILREYVRTYITGMSSIIAQFIDEPDMVNIEAGKFAFELKSKLYDEFGVY